MNGNQASEDDIDKWRQYWKDKDSPLHRHNDDFFYQLYADEINLILRRFGFAGGDVLESGCGNGALFPFLNLEKSKYTGMDISSSLLNDFRAKYPSTTLIEDSAENIPGGPYTLIFSNGVGQYFNGKRLSEYINRSVDALSPGGLLIIGNLLWKASQSNFISGVYADVACRLPVGKLESARRFLKAIVGSENASVASMGYWINPKDILEVASLTENTILGSIFHPYRFTFVGRKLK